jgi:hypothetical protein
MMRRWYRTVTRPINRGPTASICLGFLAIAGAVVPAGGRGQGLAVEPFAASTVGLVADFARAHPSASGPLTIVRHVHAHARTTTERGTLRLGREGALLRLGERGAPSTEMSIRADVIEAFDAAVSPAMVLVARGETPLARYAAVLGGEDASVLFRERVLETRAGHVRAELVPTTPWLGVERLVIDVVADGAERGRVERCLWLDGSGNWQRFDLEGLRYSNAALEPSTLVLSAHPGARRVEL